MFDKEGMRMEKMKKWRKEGTVKEGISNVYNLCIILRIAAFPRGKLAAFYSQCCLFTYSFRLDRRDSLYLITVTPQSPYKLHRRVHALSCHPAPPANPAVAFRTHKTRLWMYLGWNNPSFFLYSFFFYLSVCRSALVGFVAVFRCVIFHKLEWSVFNFEFSSQCYISHLDIFMAWCLRRTQISENKYISFLRWNGWGRSVLRCICSEDQ